MLNSLPEGLKGGLREAILDSLKDGEKVRRRATLRAFGIMLLLLVFTFELPSHYMVATIIASGTVLIVRAIFSLSASLNSHNEGILRLIVHYAEENKKP
jgi:hypothetical protein